MNSTMSRDFYLEDGKIVVNTSFALSDYGRVNNGQDNDFQFSIEATTIGLKTESQRIKIIIEEVYD